MKRILYSLVIVSVVLLGFNSCDGFGSADFEEDLLIGKWENDRNPGEYWVYTTQTDDSGDYQYGHTWDENDDVYESDLTPYGNGWFKWQIVKSDLTQIHLMENGGADIPKIYTITELTTTHLTYKDSFGNRTYFTKVK